MRLLLDTHALLWMWQGSALFSARGKEAIRDPANDVFFSPVSAFEISTKYHFGKLPIAERLVRDFAALTAQFRLQTIDIRTEHGLRAGSYSPLHRDPFDRLLAAQAELEDAALITRDPAFFHFPCRVFW